MAKLKEGALIEKREIVLNSDLLHFLKEKGVERMQLRDAQVFAKKIRVYRIVYQSNGHRVTGFLCEPRVRKGRLPCVIWNRGGLGEFGVIKVLSTFRVLGRIASWGYVVIASQYSGNAGSEGKDDCGGPHTLNDVLVLRKILEKLSAADPKRIGMYGGSRGGMMTYLALAKVKWIKAAVVVAGLADVQRNLRNRPDLRRNSRRFWNVTKENIRDRSVVRWSQKISKKTPVLLMHGTADWRVSPQDSLDLSGLFYTQNVPHRLVMFEGGDHGLTEHYEERYRLTREWLDRYVKSSTPLPNLKPHGP